MNDMATEDSAMKDSAMKDTAMNDIMDRIELLVSRSLDGELGSEEELELNRELLRNPAARQVLDDARRLEALASASIQTAVPDRAVSIEAAMRLADGPQHRMAWHHRMPRMHRGWWLVPGAIAAALLAVGVSRESVSDLGQEPDLGQQTAMNSAPTMGQVMQSEPQHLGDSVMRNVNHEPQRRTLRDISRETFSIVVDPTKIYLIEVDRTRVLRERRRPHLPRERM